MPTLAKPRQQAAVEVLRHPGVHGMFGDLAHVLASKLRGEVSLKLSARNPTRDFERQLATVLPGFIEDAFIKEFLSPTKGAALRRAHLVHLLSTANLEHLPGKSTQAPSLRAFITTLDLPSHDDGDDETLTSEEAARLLHVSRTHLNGLADSGVLGTVQKTTGGHRRILKAQVLAYKQRQKKKQAEGLEAMHRATEEMGLYDREVSDVRARRKG